VAFQRRAWERLRSERPAAAIPEGVPRDARDRFAEGTPLLISARPSFAGHPPLDLLADLAALAASSFEAPGAELVERAARRGAAPAREALDAALRRDAAALDSAAARMSAPTELTASLCELAASPSLRALAGGAAGLLASAPWSRGWCPVCGAWPLLGELRASDRSRWLRCGLCASEWAYPRSACPFCGEGDHRKLTALSVAGEEDYRRAELCDGCRGYVKSVARLTPIAAELLPIEDLATGYLDVLALDAGYAKPSTSPVFPARGRIRDGTAAEEPAGDGGRARPGVR
jgi:FdhE protein